MNSLKKLFFFYFFGSTHRLHTYLCVRMCTIVCVCVYVRLSIKPNICKSCIKVYPAGSDIPKLDERDQTSWSELKCYTEAQKIKYLWIIYW